MDRLRSQSRFKYLASRHSGRQQHLAVGPRLIHARRARDVSPPPVAGLARAKKQIEIAILTSTVRPRANYDDLRERG